MGKIKRVEFRVSFQITTRPKRYGIEGDFYNWCHEWHSCALWIHWGTKCLDIHLTRISGEF